MVKLVNSKNLLSSIFLSDYLKKQNAKRWLLKLIEMEIFDFAFKKKGQLKKKEKI